MEGAALAALLAAAASPQLTSAFTTAPSMRARNMVIPMASPSSLWQSKGSRSFETHDMDPTEEPTNIKIQDADVLEKRRSTDPTPVVVSAFQKLSGEPGAAIAATALALVLMLSPGAANAAMSGGRMGGSFSSGRSSYSRPMPSRGYGSGYSSGFRSGYYSRPSVTVAPIVPSPFVSPFYNPFMPRPFFFGGPGAVVYGRGPSIFDLLFIGGIGLFIMSAIRTASAGNSLMDVSSDWGETVTSPLGTGTSVAQITVALEVPNRDAPSSVLNVLDRIAQTAKTDSRVGIQNLTSQVALELLRRKDSIVSASTRYKHFNDRNKADRDFNSLSIKERGKFEQENVSRYGGVDYGSGSSRGNGLSSDSKATIAVVTIMVNIDGDSTKLPKIGSVRDVEEALRKIASDARVSDCLQGAEILWTPEDRSETLTLREVVSDYPDLMSV